MLLGGCVSLNHGCNRVWFNLSKQQFKKFELLNRVKRFCLLAHLYCAGFTGDSMRLFFGAIALSLIPLTSTTFAGKPTTGGGSGADPCGKRIYKTDTKVDQPHSIASITQISANTVKVIALKGYDANGISDFPSYSIRSASGVTLTSFPDNLPGSTTSAFDVNFTGLSSGTVYTMVVHSNDYCADYAIHNRAEVKWDFTIAPTAQESNPPQITKSMFNGVEYFLGWPTAYGVGVYAVDDSAIIRTRWLADGVQFSERNYAYIHGYLPLKSAEGQGQYYTTLTCAELGRPVLFTAEIIDIFGNVTKTSATYNLPKYQGCN